MRPYIGVVPLYDSGKNSLWMLPGYMEGIIKAGGIPVIMPLTTDSETIKSLEDSFDGFLFTGGQDVDPALYGEEKTKACGEVCKPRDEMEKQLLECIIERDKPLLGICRGIQFVNAALGGTLYQDLKTQHPSGIEHVMTPPYDRAVHYVSVLDDTPLSKIVNGTDIGVNSYHHQAVKELSPLLKPMAAADGLVEAAYMENKKFLMLVQWHPELSFETDENSMALFKAFVDACL